MLWITAQNVSIGKMQTIGCGSGDSFIGIDYSKESRMNRLIKPLDVISTQNAHFIKVITTEIINYGID